jgi:hypothetical protein
MKKTLSVLIILIFISNDIIAQQTPGECSKRSDYTSWWNSTYWKWQDY